MIVRASGFDGRYVLIQSATGIPVSIGELVTDHRGDKASILDGAAPHKPSSSGRVYVHWKGIEATTSLSYFPHVFGLEWRKCVAQTERTLKYNELEAIRATAKDTE